jgi:hypothetical protein
VRYVSVDWCLDIVSSMPPMPPMPPPPVPLHQPIAPTPTPSVQPPLQHIPSVPGYPPLPASNNNNNNNIGMLQPLASSMAGQQSGPITPLGISQHPATSALATQIMLLQAELERNRLEKNDDLVIRKRNDDTIVSLRHEVASIHRQLTDKQLQLEAAQAEIITLKAALSAAQASAATVASTASSVASTPSTPTPFMPPLPPPGLPSHDIAVAHGGGSSAAAMASIRVNGGNNETKQPAVSSLAQIASGEDGKLAVVPPEAVWVDDNQTTGVLGNGAYGVTYRGTVYDGVVAVKRMHGLILGPHNLRRWQREVGIMANVKHPNLVMLYGVCYRPNGDLLVPDLLMEVSHYSRSPINACHSCVCGSLY